MSPAVLRALSAADLEALRVAVSDEIDRRAGLFNWSAAPLVLGYRVSHAFMVRDDLTAGLEIAAKGDAIDYLPAEADVLRVLHDPRGKADPIVAERFAPLLALGTPTAGRLAIDPVVVRDALGIAAVVMPLHPHRHGVDKIPQVRLSELATGGAP